QPVPGVIEYHIPLERMNTRPVVAVNAMLLLIVAVIEDKAPVDLSSPFFIPKPKPMPVIAHDHVDVFRSGSPDVNPRASPRREFAVGIEPRSICERGSNFKVPKPEMITADGQRCRIAFGKGFHQQRSLARKLPYMDRTLYSPVHSRGKRSVISPASEPKNVARRDPSFAVQCLIKFER